MYLLSNRLHLIACSGFKSFLNASQPPVAKPPMSDSNEYGHQLSDHQDTENQLNVEESLKIEIIPNEISAPIGCNLSVRYISFRLNFKVQNQRL